MAVVRINNSAGGVIVKRIKKYSQINTKMGEFDRYSAYLQAHYRKE